MIVKIGKAGASFKGLGAYLTGNKERVAWTHSLNCAHDDAPSVIHEMLTTYRDAELLKEQAGVHAGGSPLEKPVKHVSLSWHPDEKPTREEMIAAATDFLKEMGWDQHQAFLVAHDDMEHRHVHIMLNRVHPENGVALNERFERVRAQDWALDYEREQGKILCEQRVLEPTERTPSPNRSTWEKLREFERDWDRQERQAAYDPDYLSREDQRSVIKDHEWELLKKHQREEREAFFADGKQLFKEIRSEVFREVREIARPAWRQYYETGEYRESNPAQTNEDRHAAKAELVAWQNGLLEEKRDEACAGLREQRDEQYRALLDRQKEERHELTGRQEMGLASPHLLDYAGQPEGKDLTKTFAAAASETTDPANAEPLPAEAYEDAAVLTPAENPRVRHGFDMAGDMGMGLLGALGTIGERLFDGFFGGPPAANQNDAPKPEPRPEPSRHSQEARERAIARSVDAAIKAAENEAAMQRDQQFWHERRRERERD